MNLYQIHRPLLFEDVYGHERIINEFIKRAKEGTWPKSMLFSGPTGVGKTTMARIIGKTVLCQNKDENNNPCNKCSVCVSIDKEKGSSNYIEYDATNLLIEDIRAIGESSRKKVMSTLGKRIIAIDELQALKKSPASLSAMLKILENPSSSTMFLLGTMDKSIITPALADRTTIYNMGPVPPDEIANYLLELVIEEEEPYKENVLFTLAQNSGGSVRKATTLLERVIFSDLWEVDKDVLSEELDIFDEDSLKDTFSKIAARDYSFTNSKITDKMLDEILNRFILLFILKSGGKLNKYDLSRLHPTWQTITLSSISEAIEILNESKKLPYLTPTLCKYFITKVTNVIIIEDIKPKSRRKVVQ